MSTYLNYAAAQKDPVERMKAVIAVSVSFIYKQHSFMKPLNPILGETLQAKMGDGGMLYCEQTSHHPPRSHFHIVGPNNNYEASGWIEFSIFSWPNSAIVTIMGYKVIKFRDGQVIRFNHPNAGIYNIIVG